MTRPILYISGPYSAGNGRTTERNIDTARAYAVAAWNMGWAAITPHLNTAHFETLCPNLDHADWLDGDLTILSRLDPHIDAMLLLPGWTRSKGAQLERDWALHYGLEVIGPVDSPEHIPAPGTRTRHYCDERRRGCICDGDLCRRWNQCSIRGRCR